ncbi:MAG: endonuclease/exonuclease/phosphatase family protein [Opitutaceae bacterium]|nr:endonuclease/exonuclease/phosphatase family protein [Opitutaceae bacterium]
MPPSSNTRLRIVSYNIAHGRGLHPIQGLSMRRTLKRNLDRIAELLVTLKPDIVALQEIDQHSWWAGRFDQLDYLKSATGFEHAAFGLNNRRGGMFPLNYGNAILSRHPIRFIENVAFGRKRWGEKGFLFAEIELGKNCVPLFNMHLHYRSRSERLRQAQWVASYLEAQKRARGDTWSVSPVLCGDLNNPARTGDATASLFRYFATHGHYTLFPQRARTFPSPLPRRTLDFIFLPPGCDEVFCLVVKSLLSDHLPVLVECSLS